MHMRTLQPTNRLFLALVCLSLLISACATPAAAVAPTVTVEKEEVDESQLATAEPIATVSPELALELSELGKIAFTASDGGRRDVWLIRPDGSEESNLTGDLANTFAEAPVWAPDGNTIAFDGVPNSDEVRDIYIVSVSDNPTQSRITQLKGFDCYPSFSPDGQQIVYMSERDGNRDLYIMDLEGNDIRRLTAEPTYDYEPAWSPDGEQIVFVSRRTGDSEIYIMDADGTNLELLNEAPKLDWRPAWSPDGEWIAFESWRNGNADIYMMRRDGSDLQQLTTSQAEDGHPHFSPDGRYIVFHSRRTGDYQLFILEVANPENQWHLETESVRALLPVWSAVVDPGE
jgi:TolB protein